MRKCSWRVASRHVHSSNKGGLQSSASAGEHEESHAQEPRSHAEQDGCPDSTRDRRSAAHGGNESDKSSLMERGNAPSGPPLVPRLLQRRIDGRLEC